MSAFDYRLGIKSKSVIANARTMLIGEIIYAQSTYDSIKSKINRSKILEKY